MIHYHGGPITPETAAEKGWRGRHAFISYYRPDQIRLAAGITQSFALDNGAFSYWKDGRTPNWSAYYEWCADWLTHPACDWAVIPDVIDGSEEENDELIGAWPFRNRGVPVWHMHESFERLGRLCQAHERVALGSSGAFKTVGTADWWERMDVAMAHVCVKGRPPARLHGLRMLNPKVFSKLPLASADSTNVARNIGIDQAWKGTYAPATKEARAVVIADRIEFYQATSAWDDTAFRERLFS